VWGDEADLVFAKVDSTWGNRTANAASAIHVPDTEMPWLYWCRVDGSHDDVSNVVIDSW
jgi:hypothetical protein